MHGITHATQKWPHFLPPLTQIPLECYIRFKLPMGDLTLQHQGGHTSIHQEYISTYLLYSYHKLHKSNLHLHNKFGYPEIGFKSILGCQQTTLSCFRYPEYQVEGS